MANSNTEVTSISSIQANLNNSNQLAETDNSNQFPNAAKSDQSNKNITKHSSDSDKTAKDMENHTEKSRIVSAEVKGNNSVKNGTKKPKKTQVESVEMQDTCAIRRDEHMMDHMPFYKSCHHKFCFKNFVFLLMLSLNVADLVSDWLFYSDVAATENGLVYGQPEASMKYSLLAFSIVGSFTFTFEIVNLWWEIYRDNPWLDSDLLSAITVWIEDVPQIVINVFIAACREEAISYFQLVKASIIILGAIIRIIVSMIRYCSKRARHDLECVKKNIESCRHVVYRVFIMTGLFITLAGATTVFMFTQSERNPDGSINFKVPHSIIDGEYDDQKYFQNVSVYFSHKLVDFSGTINHENDVNLIKLAMINDIRNKETDLTVKIEYDNPQGSSSKIVISHIDSTSSQQIKECFEIDRTGKTVTTGTNCQSYITGQKSEIVFKFHFVERKVPGLVFGDITYNAVEKVSTTCSSLSFTIEDNIAKRINNPDVAAMHYFRLKNGFDGQYPTIHTSGNAAFYHSSNLTDVTSVWKTGFATCSSTGSVAPHLDNGISVSC